MNIPAFPRIEKGDPDKCLRLETETKCEQQETRRGDKGCKEMHGGLQRRVQRCNRNMHESCFCGSACSVRLDGRRLGKKYVLQWI